MVQKVPIFCTGCISKKIILCGGTETVSQAGLTPHKSLHRRKHDVHFHKGFNNISGPSWHWLYLDGMLTSNTITVAREHNFSGNLSTNHTVLQIYTPGEHEKKVDPQILFSESIDAHWSITKKISHNLLWFNVVISVKMIHPVYQMAYKTYHSFILVYGIVISNTDAGP